MRVHSGVNGCIRHLSAFSFHVDGMKLTVHLRHVIPCCSAVRHAAGATAHYATTDLDAGPIIEQGVVRITHRDSVDDMIREGKNLERMVLARAVRWHLENRVMIHGNKTVVFN